MLILPELASTEYVFNTREELSKLAEDIPRGDTCQSWIRTCKERQVHVCDGLAQRDGDEFFNIAVLNGPDGFIGKYRKVHLWDEEKLFFEPGDIGCPIFYFPFGRVGMIVCYDGWYPEVSRILALKGADIICDPACWVFVVGIPMSLEFPLRLTGKRGGPLQKSLQSSELEEINRIVKDSLEFVRKLVGT